MATKAKSKICTQCKSEKSLEEFAKLPRAKDGRQSACKECYRNLYSDNKETRKAYYQNNKEVIKKKVSKYNQENKEARKLNNAERYLKKTYKLTIKGYKEILALQEYKCKICGIDAKKIKKKLSVDHDHATGEIRGLLCQKCNTGLGMFQDSVNIMKEAIKYLNTPTDRPLAIAIDLDDCTLNFLPALIKTHKTMTGKEYKVKDFKEWGLPEDINQTFKEYEECLYVSLKAKVGAIDSILKFKRKGYKIIFITARSERFRQETEFNLKSLGLPYDELFFNKRKALKLIRLQELYNVVAFIDDKLSTVKKVAEETKIKNIFLFDMPWSKNEDMPENVVRINSIADIGVLK